MAFDAHVNFGYGNVAVAPSPATTGTTLSLVAGQGAIMPTPPFNATVWPATSNPLISNAEIVRCTARATDQFTIQRHVEGSNVRAISIGDQFAATITAKLLTDIEALVSPSTVKATYRRVNPSAVVFYTGISAADGTTVITSRTSAGVSALGSLFQFIQNTTGLTDFIARWDEGNPSVFVDEYIRV